MAKQKPETNEAPNSEEQQAPAKKKHNNIDPQDLKHKYNLLEAALFNKDDKGKLKLKSGGVVSQNQAGIDEFKAGVDAYFAVMQIADPGSRWIGILQRCLDTLSNLKDKPQAE
ncbi:hypothetical protein COW36_06770 [bacterium (Candidatus Blackallbacteria) CG17_big_fil_post_rev_8_21_14_2_50_48_46]|uniref:Uncharacterized protein n=1 Tax=bacterium (Candidatus Blackallbacteria) CG17_big_fil_post_rev_8_21_14_2_50_48_46 TaxID=2014261 RepID=A0A2M7G7C8_9BACT|nr:MAG: hypothetical protein COW64_12180 [bacterium (Candidatus Blackallbacteria) CG18_big_fil_WC_8_21_14_2_50_49_26]PIW17970.1 MAG: hypothetical protein COW36_06770 [bacterium (Candidatus Blackallbacteria) CG17_big_fil_post_rev_8_21_14_2_50_48_46]PIW45793.1 MAG: hypothetical protein COW20_18865 [bacterium (Candidatus Blackallbacteria) CG13_big_fil_rev_8_21_14_2_50_49_14]